MRAKWAPCMAFRTLGCQRDEVPGGGQLVDQPHAQSLSGGNAVGGKEHLQCGGLTEQTRQALGATPAGHQSQGRAGVPEGRSRKLATRP